MYPPTMCNSRGDRGPDIVTDHAATLVVADTAEVPTADDTGQVQGHADTGTGDPEVTGVIGAGVGTANEGLGVRVL